MKGWDTKFGRHSPVARIGLAAALIIMLSAVSARAVRIKDITEIKGVRQNQLVGYGLVVGLMGTGDKDKTKFTFQSLASMLEKMGLTEIL